MHLYLQQKVEIDKEIGTDRQRVEVEERERKSMGGVSSEREARTMEGQVSVSP